MHVRTPTGTYGSNLRVVSSRLSSYQSYEADIERRILTKQKILTMDMGWQSHRKSQHG